METNKSGSVLNAAQTAYARKVEAILARRDPSAPPVPGAWIIWSISQGWSPSECYEIGSRIAVDA